MSNIKSIRKDIYKLSLNTHKRTDLQMTFALSAICNDLIESEQLEKENAEMRLMLEDVANSGIALDCICNIKKWLKERE